MLSLTILSILGVAISFAVHVSIFFFGFQPSHLLVTGLNVGVGFLFCAIGIISRQIEQRFDRKVSTDVLLRKQPNWFKTICGVVAVYGVVMFIFFLGGAITAASAIIKEVTHDKFHTGLSALIMVFYLLEFSLLFSYRKVWKQLEEEESFERNNGIY